MEVKNDWCAYSMFLLGSSYTLYLMLNLHFFLHVPVVSSSIVGLGLIILSSHTEKFFSQADLKVIDVLYSLRYAASADLNKEN